MKRGLMNSVAQVGDTGMAPGNGQDPGALPEEDGDYIQASPEEQAQFDKFMDNAYKLIYGDETFQKVLDALGSHKDPIEALATATVTIIMQLHANAKEKGVELSPDVLMHGGTEILTDLAEVATKAGIHKFTNEDVEAAYYLALDRYRELATKAGLINPDDFKADFEAMKQADMNGTLDDVFPQLKQITRKQRGKPSTSETEDQGNGAR